MAFKPITPLNLPRNQMVLSPLNFDMLRSGGAGMMTDQDMQMDEETKAKLRALLARMRGLSPGSYGSEPTAGVVGLGGR